MFEGRVTHVALPGEEGDMVILENHAPINTLVRTGAIYVGVDAGKEKAFFIRDASLTVRSDRVRLLAETILDLKTLDAQDIGQQLKAAEEDVQDAKTDEQKKITLKKHKRLKEIYDALDQAQHHDHYKQDKHS
jgi:F-type H+-transporting ATPase subunit epsilon